VTITHPFHPWNGQQVKVIYIQRGADPDLMVQRPDGRHVMVAMSGTDYAGSVENEPRLPLPLLDVEGLHQVVRLIESMRREDHYPAKDNNSELVDPLPKPMLNDK